MTATVLDLNARPADADLDYYIDLFTTVSDIADRYCPCEWYEWVIPGNPDYIALGLPADHIGCKRAVYFRAFRRALDLFPQLYDIPASILARLLYWATDNNYHRHRAAYLEAIGIYA